MEYIDQVLKFFGQVALYGGGSTVLSYAIFKKLGAGWINARFAERLEAFKHQQALEVARLKVEVESVLSGSLKLQEKEFSILPEAWKSLHEAYGLTCWVTSPLQEYPNLAQMSETELEEFLAGTELPESQKEKIKLCDWNKRNNTYQSVIFWIRIHKAKVANGELQKYVAANGIFLPPDLKAQFSEMTQLLWNALSTYEIGHESTDWKLKGEAWKDLQAKAEPLHKSIEASIGSRLHSHAKKST